MFELHRDVPARTPRGILYVCGRTLNEALRRRGGFRLLRQATKGAAFGNRNFLKKIE
jgi:hypothetical protein